MIKEFVDRFNERKGLLRDRFSSKHPEDYKEIVHSVISILDSGVGKVPDPERIHEIDDGDFQGTLLYCIAAKGYQPSTYWYVFIDYGSCSGCDTLDNIRESVGSLIPTPKQVDDYMVLALHIVQKLHLIPSDWEPL